MKGKINVNEHIAAFLNYLETRKPNDEYTQRLEHDAGMARMNKEWRVEYMKTYVHDMDVRNEGIRIGISQGISSSIIEVLREYGCVPDYLKEKINNKKNADVLKKWLKYAVSSSTVEEFEQKVM